MNYNNLNITEKLLFDNIEIVFNKSGLNVFSYIKVLYMLLNKYKNRKL